MLAAFDPYTSNCPARQVLDRIGDRWTVLVMGLLAAGPRRHMELSRGIQGISPKMLTQTLRALERDGLVSRTVYAVVPPRVDYELTPLGTSLSVPLHALSAWAVENMDSILKAREAFDS